MQTPAVSKSTQEPLSQIKIKKILRERFGLTALRETQNEVIQAVMRKENTLAILPTGAGKSLCFQLPALMIPGTTLVISPLIALMKDQQEKLEELDIEAFQLNSSLSKSEQDEGLDALEDGTADFIYTTPERLQNAEFLAQLKETDIDFIVIDEAHCITEWGHDFRPAYLAIRDAVASLGHPPILALTATATTEVASDIQKQLGLKSMTVIRSSVLRKNLEFEAHLNLDDEEKNRKLEEVLANIGLDLGDDPGADEPACGVIYASSVKAVDELFERYRDRDGGVAKYHGKLTSKARRQMQDAFMSGQAKLMIATNAFGMGIDKPDIRFIIHYNFPGSLESYYQETGRAGRDGKTARCVLLYLKKDQRTQNFFLAGKHPKHEQLVAVFRILEAFSDRPLPIAELQEACPGVPKSKVRVVLNTLRDAKLIQIGTKGTRLTGLGRSRAWTDAELLSVSDQFEMKKSADREKLKNMIVYAQTALCRWSVLLKYFGETGSEDDCGTCDNCRRGGLKNAVGEVLKRDFPQEFSSHVQSPVA